jgi:K+-transporting ATPase KdpF subunit
MIAHCTVIIAECTMIANPYSSFPSISSASAFGIEGASGGVHGTVTRTGRVCRRWLTCRGADGHVRRLLRPHLRTLMIWVTVIVTLFLLGYLFAALLRPEWF